MRLFLGVDGGGTRSTAAVCDAAGKVVGWFEGDALNYTVIGLEKARDHLRSLLAPLLSDPSIELISAVLGIAALDDIADKEETGRLCDGILSDVSVMMHSDVFAALCSVSLGGPAAAAICGTGSMAAGRTEDGSYLHAGGWGPLLGDEGSGYRIGLEAVRAAIRGGEGSGERTLLTSAFMQAFELNSLADCIKLFYDAEMPHSKIAAFCPYVFSCEDRGDHAASTVIQTELAAFSETTLSLLRRLPAETPLGLWGGLFKNRQSYAHRFADLIAKEFPLTEIGILKVPPAVGAARAAANLYHNQGRTAFVL